jgi:hypothetical protein
LGKGWEGKVWEEKGGEKIRKVLRYLLKNFDVKSKGRYY